MHDQESFDQPLKELLELIRFIGRVSTKLYALTDEDAIYQAVCDEFAQFGRYTVSIARLTEDDTKLKIIATSNPSEVLDRVGKLTGLSLSNFMIDLSRSAIYRQVVKTGESIQVAVDDILRELLPKPLATLLVKTLGYEGKRSILVPMRDQDKIIAVIGVSAPTLAAEFIPTVETLAHHIANTLHAARERKHREQTERVLFEQQRELTARTRLLESILLSFDIDQRLATILEEVLSFLRAGMGGIYLREDAEKFVLRRWRGISDDLRAQISTVYEGDFPLPPGKEEPLIIHERLSEQGVVPDFMKSVEIQALVSIPLAVQKGAYSGQECIGVLFVAYRGYEELNEPEIRFLQTMGNYLALTIDHSRQFRHAAQRLTRLEVLREIDRAIISRLSIDKIMEIVLEHVPPELGADAVAISLFDGGRAHVHRMRLPNGTIVHEQAFDLSENLIDWFVDRQTPIVIHDLSRDSRVRLNREFIRKHRLVSYLGVPLIADSETIGILHIVTVHSTVFSSEDVEFFQTLAGQAAIAIKSARMFAGIEEAEKRYRGIFENAAEGIYQATLDGQLILVNPAMAQILGYETPDEFLTAVPNISQIYTDSGHRAEFMQALEQEGVVRNFDTQVRRRDGTTAWVSKSAHIIRDEHGQALYYEGICDDITDRVQVEQELRESQKRYDALITSINGILWEASVSAGRFTFVSKQVERMLGYPVEQWLTDPMFWQDHLHPDDREQTLALSGKAVAEKQGYELEYRMIAADGRTVWLRDIVTVDVEGDQPAKLRGVAVEITDRKRIEKELQQYRAHLEQSVEARTAELRLRIAALEASANAIAITDTKGKIVWANLAFTSLSGYSLEEVLGQSPRILKSGKQDQAFYKHLWRTIRAGNVWHGELINRRKDGTLYTEEMTITPVNDEDGRITHFVAVKQDITVRKHMEDTLHKAVNAAEAANLAKSQFLANMSHELRTPLNAIIGFSQVLQDEYFGPLADKQAEYVNDILESGYHLLSLINDILDLSKIEAGDLKLELAPVDLKQLLEDSLILIKEKARAHGISLTLELPAALGELTIMTDARRLKQVLLNLLSNAAKFTPDGGAIELGARMEGEDVLISVSDTGIGIAPEEQDRIFDEFYQVSKSGKIQGTGLGLAISKQIVERQGGKIWVESAGEGAGSRFCFTIPIDRDEKRVFYTPEAAAFLKRLEGVIDQTKRYDRVFTICQLRGLSAVLPGRKELIKDVLISEVRSYDFCDINREGHICVVFPDIGGEEAQLACKRILSKLENMVPNTDLHCFKAEFPVDGKTIEELMQHLEQQA